MTEGKQGGPIEPPEDEMLPGDIQEAPDETPNTETGSALSVVGLVCQSILTTINGSDALSDDDRTAIVSSVNTIICLSREETARTEALKKKLAAQKAKLKRANEHLALLRQEIFGQSSEQVCSTSEFDSELAELAEFEDLEDEAPKAKGKRQEDSARCRDPSVPPLP